MDESQVDLWIKKQRSGNVNFLLQFLYYLTVIIFSVLMELNSNSIIDHFLLLGIDNETQLQTKINSITVLATITSNSSEKINEYQIISCDKKK